MKSKTIAKKPWRGKAARNKQRGRKWVLTAMGAMIVVVAAAVLIGGIGSSGEDGPRFIHGVGRGDLIVTVMEQGLLESSKNEEIKCKVRGLNTVTWIIESGAIVEPGDVLVRLDTLAIEDALNERSKYAHWARSTAKRSKADVARAELAIQQYLEGRYKADLMTMEKDLSVAKSNLRSARSILAHATQMANRGYVSELELEQSAFAVIDANLSVEVTESDIENLKTYTKAMQLETLYGNLRAAKAKYAADEERARMDETRRDIALEELAECVIKAENSGMVIHPSAAQWENAPKIEEGSTVHKDQTVLLMPDLSRMEVMVGIKESAIDRLEPNLPAKVTLPTMTLEGKVSTVASVTRPAGWWTANEVRYDTTVEVPAVKGLRPGMSAEVEIVVARYTDVLSVPVAAVVETEYGSFCWIKTSDGPKRVSLILGDTNDRFTVVEAGLSESDEVFLNPYALEEHRSTGSKTNRPTRKNGSKAVKSGAKASAEMAKDKSPEDVKQKGSKLEGALPGQGDSGSEMKLK